MSEKSIKYGPSLPIDALSDAIGGDEALYGPLKALAAGETTNYAIFDRRKSHPPYAELVIGSQPPDGYVKICGAKLLILDVLLEVVAVRKS